MKSLSISLKRSKDLLSVISSSSCCFQRKLSKYEEDHRRSISDPESYWAEAADKLVWFKKWEKVLDDSNPPSTKWFVGGEMSHCYNCVDRHVQNGRGNQVAIIHDSPITNTMHKLTYNDLLREVSTLAGSLARIGVKKGDRVMIYMPMIPQAVVAMQAVLRLGAVHVVVFGGFAAKELSVRIDHCKPTVVISASCGVEPTRVVNYKPILDEAINLAAHKPKQSIIFQRPDMEVAKLKKGADVSWEEVMSRDLTHDCVPVESNHPLYLLYTSGTTGLPKGVVRPTAPHSVRLHWTMNAIYDVKPGEVFWAASDLGWTVGHSYICHGPLVNGDTTVIFEVYWAAADLGWAVGHSYGAHATLLYGAQSVIYEGKPVGTPDASTFFRIVNDHKVACLFTAPTALRSIKREDPHAEIGSKYDLSSLRSLFVAGEHCDVDTADWSARAFKVPVLDHWWQTETGSAITSTCLGLGNRTNAPSGSTGLPVPGWDLRVVNDDGEELPNGELGNLVAKLPLPPGTFQTLWANQRRYVDTYFTSFKGYYDTMDAGVKDEEGYISVMSRTDDVINVAGHRLSCGHIEEAINSHTCVVECAVVALSDQLKGSVPFGFVVCTSDVEDFSELSKDLVHLVRTQIGPVAAFKQAVPVRRLPKTRSGKTPRSSLQAIINNQPYAISPTIEDASVYPELEAAVEKLNLANS